VKRARQRRDVSGQTPAEEGKFGAGIVAGASDNDPTTVATLAVVGSTTIYGLAWLTLLIIPMLAVVQAIAAEIAVVTRKGLEECVQIRYGPIWAWLALVSVLAVNLLTLAADLEGGGAALQLLTHADYRVWIVPLGAGTVALLVFGNYGGIERVLRYAALLFLTYVAAAFLAKPDWAAVLRGSLVPHFAFTSAYIGGALALLGTTLTAYAYVWETIEVAEERPKLGRIGLVQVDAALGIVVAGLSFWFILIATGATLGVHHHPVETAEDAARALVPVAGKYAGLVFAVGLLGSALVAVPVIAGTSAYVAAEMFRWRITLDDDFEQGKPFYLTLAGAVAAAAAIGLLGVPPIKLLFLSGIAGGIATPFTLVLMLLVGRDAKVMHRRPISPLLAAGGWLVAATVTAATLVYFWQSLTGSGN